MTKTQAFLFAAIGFAIAAEVIHALWQPTASLYGVDSHMLLAAAREMAESGLPRLPYWPNSSAGLDLLYWSHFLLSQYYAIGVRLFDFGRAGMEVLLLGDLLLAMAVTFMFVRKTMPSSFLILAMAFIFYEPGFNFLVVEKQYLRLAVMVGLAGAYCIVAAYDSDSSRTRLALALFCGVFASLSPLIFVSQGVPIAVGVAAAFLIENWNSTQLPESKLQRTVAFVVGALLPTAAVGAYIVLRLDPETFRTMIRAMSYYGEVVTPTDSLFREFLSLGYFFSSIVVSPYGLSVLPVGIAAAVVNAFAWRRLSGRERLLVRLALICISSWVAFALVVPTHFYAARLNWLVPLLVPQLWFVIRDVQRLPGGPYAYFLPTLGILVAQLIHKFLLDPTDPFMVGVAAAIGGVLGLARMAVAIVVRRLRFQIKVPILLLSILVCLPAASRYSEALTRKLPDVLAHIGVPALVDEVGAASRMMLGSQLEDGEWALTDVPMVELFPAGVRLQAIHEYRGLLTGGRSSPADVMVLFQHGPYVPRSDSETVYYRGHVYELGPWQNLPAGYRMRSGKPTQLAEKDAVVRRDSVSTEDVMRYLTWREENGLPVK